MVPGPGLFLISLTVLLEDRSKIRHKINVFPTFFGLNFFLTTCGFGRGTVNHNTPFRGVTVVSGAGFFPVCI